MELKVIMKLNNNQTIEANFEGKDLPDVIRSAGCLLDFDGVCGFCKSQNTTLETRVVTSKKDNKKYRYTSFVCRDCKATCPLGEFQDGSGLFLKEWVEPYKGE